MTFTTQTEREAQARQVELERQQAERNRRELESRNADLERQAEVNRPARERELALEQEEQAAIRGRELTARLQNARGEVESLRAQVTTEREGKELAAELEAAERGLAARGRLVETPVAEVERLLRLRALAELWPARLNHLKARLAQVEADVVLLEKQLAETTGLFQKARAAVAKIIGRESVT